VAAAGAFRCAPDSENEGSKAIYVTQAASRNSRCLFITRLFCLYFQEINRLFLLIDLTSNKSISEMSDSETNQLLREIRDLLASREAKYDEHLKRIQGMYVEQINTGAKERQKSVRVVFALILLLAGLVAMAVYFSK